MTLPGETVGTGAPGPDKDPNIVGPKVMQSAAGYYIGFGYLEDFGDGERYEVPYSRESGYYKTREIAEAALPSFLPDIDPAENFHARGTQFDPQGELSVEHDGPSL